VAASVLREIGEEDGEGLVFGLISDVEVLPDGSLLVVDRLRTEVLHVTPEGEVLAIVGGRGEGPGEFATPMDVALTGPSEYLVLDGDRMHLTHVAIQGTDHVLLDPVPMPFMALHLCARAERTVMDPVLYSHALAMTSRDGSVVRDYHAVPEVVDESFPREAQGVMRIWEGMAIPTCLPDGGVVMLSEWGPLVEGFSPDGFSAWSVTLAPHQTLTWEVGPTGSPQPAIPVEGWAHRSTTILPIGNDLFIIQLAAARDDSTGADDDPVELRFVRPSDGAQSGLPLSLPRLAHVEGGRAWGWTNAPYPRLVLMSFDLSVN
jgi:hypothetical protein